MIVSLSRMKVRVNVNSVNFTPFFHFSFSAVGIELKVFILIIQAMLCFTAIERGKLFASLQLLSVPLQASNRNDLKVILSPLPSLLLAYKCSA